MARRFARTALRQGQRRGTLWLGGVTTRTTIAAATTAVLQTSLNAGALALRPFTIVRTRGVLRLESDQEAAQEFQDCAWGQCVVSSQAVLGGVASLPTPVTDESSDLWFAYEKMYNDLKLDAGGAAAGPTRPTGLERIVDSKAMRKVEDGEDIVAVVETGALSNGVIVTSFTRILVKLH